MKKITIWIAVGLVSVAVLIAQTRGNPGNLQVLVDATGALVSAAAAATPPYTQSRFADAQLLTDSNGALVVTGLGGSGFISGTLTSGQVPYATGMDTVASNAGLSYNSTTHSLTINYVDNSYANGLVLQNASNTDATILSGDSGTDATFAVTLGGSELFYMDPGYIEFVTDEFHIGGGGSAGVLYAKNLHVDTGASGQGVGIFNGANPSGQNNLVSGIVTDNTTRNFLYAGLFSATSTGTINNDLSGLAGIAIVNTAGTVLQAIGTSGTVALTAGATSQAFGSYIAIDKTAGTVTTAYSYWAKSLQAIGTNNYYFWADDNGVYRIRSDNTFDSVYQAIPALYNPQFTKYTPGAANYERCIPGCQWDANVAEIGTEKGGTGTLRSVKFIGAHVATTVDLSAGAYITTTTSPAVANIGADSCGTSAASIVGTDNAWVITVGATSGTACRVTFDTTAPNAWQCSTWNGTTHTLNATPSQTAQSSTTVDITGTAFVAGDTIYGNCWAR